MDPRCARSLERRIPRRDRSRISDRFPKMLSITPSICEDPGLAVLGACIRGGRGEFSFPLRKPAQSAPGGHETTRSDGRQTVARSSRERGSHSRIIRVIVGTNSVEITGSRVRRVSGSSTRDGSRLSPRVRADQQVDPLFSSPLLLSLPLSPAFVVCRMKRVKRGSSLISPDVTKPRQCRSRHSPIT